MKTPTIKAVRCAIYTRVSTDLGLDQEFNSLDAQYDAASAYIKSQAHAGWTLIRSRYDDGGYSGGSTDRPDLQRLLDDIRSRKIDVIVVYKVDRLTRSLADFAKLVELFDAHGVSFVSVTQQFNTTTSMGRLTLNVLLSFAQFEREVTSERIRDKVAASKRKGLWVGGTLPLGYHMKDDKIAVIEDEAERVRLIYRRYLELGGVNALVRDLRERNIRTKSRLLATGATRGGIHFGRGSLFYLLRNRFYIGEVKYKDEILPGEQPTIMDRALFDAVQQKLSDQWTTQSTTRNASDHLLKLPTAILTHFALKLGKSFINRLGYGPRMLDISLAVDFSERNRLVLCHRRAPRIVDWMPGDSRFTGSLQPIGFRSMQFGGAAEIMGELQLNWNALRPLRRSQKN
jgi:site-specific DNA recombinase